MIKKILLYAFLVGSSIGSSLEAKPDKKELDRKERKKSKRRRSKQLKRRKQKQKRKQRIQHLKGLIVGTVVVAGIYSTLSSRNSDNVGAQNANNVPPANPEESRNKPNIGPQKSVVDQAKPNAEILPIDVNNNVVPRPNVASEEDKNELEVVADKEGDRQKMELLNEFVPILENPSKFLNKKIDNFAWKFMEVANMLHRHKREQLGLKSASEGSFTIQDPDGNWVKLFEKNCKCYWRIDSHLNNICSWKICGYFFRSGGWSRGFVFTQLFFMNKKRKKVGFFKPFTTFGGEKMLLIKPEAEPCLSLGHCDGWKNPPKDDHGCKERVIKDLPAGLNLTKNKKFHPKAYEDYGINYLHRNFNIDENKLKECPGTKHLDHPELRIGEECIVTLKKGRNLLNILSNKKSNLNPMPKKAEQVENKDKKKVINDNEKPSADIAPKKAALIENEDKEKEAIKNNEKPSADLMLKNDEPKKEDKMGKDINDNKKPSPNIVLGNVEQVKNEEKEKEDIKDDKIGGDYLFVHQEAQ